MAKNWMIWDKNLEYGNTFYMRAIGKLPEMESSKSIARYAGKIIKNNDSILDVGCGVGHYLVSLDKTIGTNFSYYGLDATKYYIQKAKKAFSLRNKLNPRRIKTDFFVGDIFNLKLENNFADIVMCNNLLLHLPSINRPLRELWRVTKRFLLIRTLVGDSSFRIMHINEPERYAEDGEPVNFNYLNIYSKQYLRKLIRKLSNVKKVSMFADNDFNPRKIGNPNYSNRKAPFNLTKVVNGMQVNHYIIYPWYLIIIEKNLP